MVEELALAFLDERVSVRSEVAGLVPWLREMVLPSFAETGHRSTGTTVHVAAEVVAPPPDDVEPLPCWNLDRGVETLPGRVDGEHVDLYDEPWGARVRVTDVGIRVSRLGDGRALRATTFRVIREILTTGGAGASGVDLHAAAVAADGDVVALAGPKGAGKTTLLAQLAAVTGVAIVSNDRLVLTHDARGWHAHGVPTFVRLRAGTAERLARRPAWVPIAEAAAGLTVAEATPPGEDVPTPLPPGDLFVSPSQLSAMLGAPLHPGGRLARIALVHRTDDPGAFAVEPLGPAARVERLTAALYGAGVEQRGPTVFEQRLGRRPGPVDPGVVGTLAHDVDCVEVRLGPGFLTDEQAAAGLLERLLGG